MILYRNSPHLSTLIFNFFQKNPKTSTIPSIFALHQTPAQRSSLHTFTSIRPPGESRLLASVLPPSHTHADPPSWQIQTPFHPSSKPHMLTPIRPPGRSRLLPIRPPSLTCSRRSAFLADPAALPPSPPSDLAWLRTCGAAGIEKEGENCERRRDPKKWDDLWCTTPEVKTH